MTTDAAAPDGAALLDDLARTLRDYVVFADGHAPAAVALWIAVTHTLDAYECAPRLVITSPQKRCAKSRLLDIIAATCHNPLAVADASVPAIFRSIGGDRPTLLVDEADTKFGTKKLAEQHEDLRALINAGHQRGRPTLRCVGPMQVPTKFDTFAMAALAGIGDLPDTITDRAVNITMRRRAPGEQVSTFRQRRDGPKLELLQQRLAEWANWHLESLTGVEPDMPVEDRAADTWEPLVVVADAAGGHWPSTARAACTALTEAADDADDDASLDIKLLTDIGAIFACQHVAFLPSAALVAALRRVEESPWDGWDLNPSKLGHRLRKFGIKTGHNPAGTARGYRLEDFSDAFRRYTRQRVSEASDPQVNNTFPSDAFEASDALTRQRDKRRQNGNVHLPGNLTPLTPSDGVSAEKRPEPRATGEPGAERNEGAPSGEHLGRQQTTRSSPKPKRDGDQLAIDDAIAMLDAAGINGHIIETGRSKKP